jgi:hypothetical protein
MQSHPLGDNLARLEQMDPRPNIDVGLIDRNRVRLAHWQVVGGCLVEHWPNGNARYIIPLSQIVVVEVMET